jgi:competence protein ComEC
MSSPASHLRAPLLWLLGPLMAGLTAARWWPPPGPGLWPLAIAAGLAGMIAAGCAFGTPLWARRAWAVSLGLSAGLGGFVLLHARHPTLHRTDPRPPREVTVTLRVQQVFPAAPGARNLSGLGVIIAPGEQDPDLAGRRIYFSAIRRISVPPRRSGAYVIRGVIESLPRGGSGDGFNDYLANLGIRQKLTRAHLMTETAPPGRFQGFCARAQDRLEVILRHGLESQPQIASLYLAMLLGEKAVLSQEQENAFMRSGTFHIFSISGLHVAVIAAALYQTGKRLRIPPRAAMPANLVVLWLYVQITGGSSPAVRAFLMIAFMLAYRAFRLPGNPLAALAAAALATLLLDPLQLFSTGFQMSYAIVAALVLMGRPLAEKWRAAWRPFALLPTADWRWYHHTIDWSGGKLVFALAGCWTAFLSSTPPGIGYFELFSPGSLAANLVIIPLSIAVIWAGFVSLLAGLVGLLPVSALINTLAALTVQVMDWLLRQGTGLPGMWFNARFRADWLAPASLVLMTAVLLAGAAGRWAPRYGGYWPPVVTLVLLLLFGVTFG